MSETNSSPGQLAGVFWTFLRLGCTSFGGPVAHIGYFQREFVERRGWLGSEQFAELVAMAQSLPGPASSQVGFAIGMVRAGLPGALAAWLGFTMPSAALMLTLAMERGRFASIAGSSLLHGLQIVAVAVVASAVLTMQRTLAPDALRLGLAAVAAAICLKAPETYSTLLVVGLSAVVGWLWLRSGEAERRARQIAVGTQRMGVLAAALFMGLLTGSLAAPAEQVAPPALFANFFKAGSLVFGGGHVVLPMLDQMVVVRGWVSRDVFVSGYGAAQAVPGPLFTFAAYLGAVAGAASHPLLNGLVSLVAIFAPGLLLMTAALPFWGRVRSNADVAAALRGVNTGVVGILAAALWRPIGVSAVRSPLDLAVAACAFTALTLARVAPWLVVCLVGAGYLTVALLG